MTEKRGGSDVSRATETVAVPEDAAQQGVGSWFRWVGWRLLGLPWTCCGCMCVCRWSCRKRPAGLPCSLFPIY